VQSGPRGRSIRLSEAAANRDLSQPYGIETDQKIGYGSPTVGPGLGGSRIFREMSARVILTVAGLPLLAGLLAIPAGGALASFAGAEGSAIFASGGAASQLYVVSREQLTPTPLGRNAVVGFSPRWSPDGTKLVFVSERDGNAELYSVTANGIDEERLTRNGVPDLHPSWTKDGLRIVFQRGTGAGAEIYSLDSVSGMASRLTRNRRPDSDPAAAPPGRWLVFVRGGHLFKMTLRGTRPRRLTSSSGLDTQPAWSPTGADIVFVRSNGTESDLYLVNANRRGLKRLTATPGRAESSPAWSPGSDKIVFRACASSPAACQLYVVNADGSGERPLVEGGVDGEQPDWQALPAKRSWDADADFFLAPNNRNPSPDAWGETTWSYLYSDNFAHDPATYHLLPKYEITDPNRQSWVLPGFVNLVVAAVVSPQMLVLHPWGGRVQGYGRNAVLGWRSPVDGRVTVTGTIRLPSLNECAVGSGALWSIDKGATVLQSGALPAGGSASLNVPVDVSRGENIYFVWDTGWDGNCDSGLLELTVAQS
jgi:TolB protein